MLKIILISLAVIVVLFVIIVALQPADFRITRSASIGAPPAVIFAKVNDLHQFQTWSPFAQLDPNAKHTYTGPQAGKDAACTWAGNSEAGEGTMTVTDSQPDKLVAMRLDFRKPFAAVNTAEFTFVPEGEQTKVSWSMSGTRNFMFKAVGLFMDFDKMVGGQFATGLATLKSQSEASSKKLAAGN